MHADREAQYGWECFLRWPDSVAIIHVESGSSATPTKLFVEKLYLRVDRRTELRTGKWVALVDAFGRPVIRTSYTTTSEVNLWSSLVYGPSEWDEVTERLALCQTRQLLA